MTAKAILAIPPALVALIRSNPTELAAGADDIRDCRGRFAPYVGPAVDMTIPYVVRHGQPLFSLLLLAAACIDFVKVGVPMLLLTWLVTVLVTPVFFPF